MTEFPAEDVITRALAKAWWPVAHVADLESRPHEAHPAELLDRPLVVWRGESGNVYVADRRCPHRGASLAIGRVQADSVACPYHGWQWDGGSGRCTRVPSLGADQERIPPAAALKTYPAQVRFGLVWTCLDEHSTEEIVDPPEWHAEDWVYTTRIAEQSTNVLFSMENFRDLAHFPFVHQATFGTPPESPFTELEVEQGEYEVILRVPYHVPDTLTGLYAQQGGCKVHYHAFAPGAVLAVMEFEKGSWMLMHFVAPTSLETTRAFRVDATTPGLRHTLDGFVRAEDMVYGEDGVVAQTLEPRRLGASLDHQVHTLSDRYTIAFRRKFVRWLEERGADADAGSNSAPARAQAMNP